MSPPEPLDPAAAARLHALAAALGALLAALEVRSIEQVRGGLAWLRKPFVPDRSPVMTTASRARAAAAREARGEPSPPTGSDAADLETPAEVEARVRWQAERHAADRPAHRVAEYRAALALHAALVRAALALAAADALTPDPTTGVNAKDGGS